jgi:hypothetical protein
MCGPVPGLLFGLFGFPRIGPMGFLWWEGKGHETILTPLGRIVASTLVVVGALAGALCGWLLGLIYQRAMAGRKPNVDRPRDTFSGLEWREHFARLTEEELRAASDRLCRAVLAKVPIADPELGRALEALSIGQTSPELVSAVRSVLERLESEYDALVGEDEEKLACTDLVIDLAFRRARAATTLLDALEADHVGMAYEAWFVIDDLDEVRRLVGMPT